MIDDDSWKSNEVDDWKDDEWKARDAIRFMNECLREFFKLAPRDVLLRLRAQYASDPRMSDYVAMIDDQLELRFELKLGESDSESQFD